MFPRQTLLEHRFYPMSTPDNKFGLELRDLEDQQWSARDILWPDSKEHNVERFDGIRLLGDSKSLVVSLDTDGLSRSYNTDNEMKYCEFEVSSATKDRGRQRHVTIHAQVLSSVSLRYRYTYANGPWHSFLSERLRRWSWLQYFKVDLDLNLLNRKGAIR